MIEPENKEFAEMAGRGNLIALSKELPADLETPVGAYMRVRNSGPSFLLESVEGKEKWGRYSFIGFHPSRLLRIRGDELAMRDADGETAIHFDGDPLPLLRQEMAAYQPVSDARLPRFSGGLVGFCSYDIARRFERLPEGSADTLGVPDAVFMLADNLIVFDNARHRMRLVANVHLPEGADPEAAYRDGVARIERMEEALDQPLGLGETAPTCGKHAAATEMMGRKGFTDAVRRIKEYIEAGDAIQVVISERCSQASELDPLMLYRALRLINPSPYMFLVDTGEEQLIGSSPEVMVRLEEGRMEVRPIAGTRHRGRDEAEDRRLADELLQDGKERAEHFMLVDLGRNDLGRVAQPGSVQVTRLMAVERYSHVMHIVSNIAADIAPGKDAFDLIRATFPAGTLSGAPKIRAMEIIDEMEPERRGAYGGAVGYISFTGNADLCITIRTFLLKDGRLHLQAGAGIVADSEPEAEFAEAMNKMAVLRKAVELAESGMDLAALSSTAGLTDAKVVAS